MQSSTIKIDSDLNSIWVQRLLNVALSLILLGLMFLLMELLSANYSDKDLPKIQNGVLDLRDYDLSQPQTIPLSGNWHFYWKELRSPEELADPSKKPSTMWVPGTWESNDFNGKKLPSHGYATYQTKVLLPEAGSQLAISVPKISSAIRLFIDDKEIASGGVLSATSESAAPGYAPGLYFFGANSTEFTITLQVSNHHLFWGGLWRPMRMASTQVMVEEQGRDFFRSAFVLAVFVTVTILNLMQFSLRPTDPLPLVIAAGCILLGIRELESANILEQAGILEFSFATTARINFLTFTLAAPVLFGYIHKTFPQQFHRVITTPVYLISIVYSVIIIFTTPDFFSSLMFYYQVFSLICIPYLLVCVVQAALKRIKGAKMMLAGSILLFVFAANDILLNLGVVDTPLIVSFGLLGFIFCQNYITYSRFIQASKDLVVLSDSLEEQVQERTSELEDANKKLEELAHKDTLTGLPNRRGIKPFLMQAMTDYSAKQDPFCIMLLDFDHFKTVNDTMGHDIGDKVLAEGAKIMRDSIRNHDYIARWGGEEFIVLLLSTPLSGAEITAEKMRKAVNKELSKAIDYPVSITIGVAEIQPEENLDGCIKRADEALFEGKEAGRNRVVVSGKD